MEIKTIKIKKELEKKEKIRLNNRLKKLYGVEKKHKENNLTLFDFEQKKEDIIKNHSVIELPYRDNDSFRKKISDWLLLEEQKYKGEKAIIEEVDFTK